MEKTTLIKIGKIAIAIAFCFVICGMAVRPALADDDHHGRGNREHDEGDDRGRYRGETPYYYAPQPNYYYAPAPNYYYAPEPDQYYYTPQPQYYPPPPSEGINLFFGLR